MYVKKFQDLENFTSDDVRAALLRDDPEELVLVAITIALASPDFPFAQEVCRRLSMHPDGLIRGNALASLGHLARRFRDLDEEAVKPLVEAALQDPDAYVRMNAKSAADEIHQFLHWSIAGHVYG